MGDYTTAAAAQEHFLGDGIKVDIASIEMAIAREGSWQRAQHQDDRAGRTNIAIICAGYTARGTAHYQLTAKDFKRNIVSTYLTSSKVEERPLAAGQSKIKAAYDNSNVPPDNFFHEYLKKKKINLAGDAYVRTSQYGQIVIPMTSGGCVVGLQRINKDGEKKFAKGSMPRNAYLKYPGEPDTIYICEGWADGKILQLVTRKTIYIAFSEQNLTNVTSIVLEQNSDADVILVADNDEGKNKKNVGVQTAKEVGARYNIKIAIPAEPGDVSDIYNHEGADGVHRLIASAQKISAMQNETPEGYLLLNSGVYKVRPNAPMIFLSSSIKIIAISYSDTGDDWGRIIEVASPKGNKVVDISMADLQGKERDVFAKLAHYGAVITTNSQSKKYLIEYIQNSKPSKEIVTVNHTGWMGKSGTFVAHSETLGQDAERYIFRSDVASFNTRGLEQRGSIQDWQAIMHMSKTSKRLQFSIFAAFAAPLLSILDKQGFNFHFFGISSSGKSTMGKVASSVYGHPDRFMNTWKTTANALESTAMAHNDLLLVLDEISQASDDAVKEIVYMLSNGQGKARSTKTSINLPIKTWTVVSISNGEKDLPSILSGRYKSDYAGGVEVRMPSIPADAGAEKGIFEDSEPTPKETIEKLQMQARDHYGAVGRAWIEYLSKNLAHAAMEYKNYTDDDKLIHRLELEPARTIALLQQKENFTEQTNRIYKNFELVAFAAHLARQAGLLDIDEHSISSAVLACFRAWRENRGGGESRERQELLERTKNFITQHLFSKFIHLGGDHFVRPIEYCGVVTNITLQSDNIHWDITQDIERNNMAYNNRIKKAIFINSYAWKQYIRDGLSDRVALKWLADANYLAIRIGAEKKTHSNYLWRTAITGIQENFYCVIPPDDI